MKRFGSQLHSNAHHLHTIFSQIEYYRKYPCKYSTFSWQFVASFFLSQSCVDLSIPDKLTSKIIYVKEILRLRVDRAAIFGYAHRSPALLKWTKNFWPYFATRCREWSLPRPHFATHCLKNVAITHLPAQLEIVLPKYIDNWQWTDLLVDAAELLSKELTLGELLPTTAVAARSGIGFTGCNTTHIIYYSGTD